MISLGLSAAGQSALEATLASNHSVKIIVAVTDLLGNRVSDISDRLLTGQVDVDASAAVSRTCLLTMLDPLKTLGFDSDSPDDGALWHNRMIKVYYGVKGPLITEWLYIPVFNGPITKLSRDDSIVSIECQGKELLALGIGWRPWTFKKGANRVQAIHDILANNTGETKFTFTDSTMKLASDYSLGRMTQAWHASRALAQGGGFQLFYDGRGVAVLRNRNLNPIFVFKGGDGGMITSSPKVSFNTDGVANMVYVKGGVPAGGKVAVEWTETAAANDSLSPWRLGRNGVPRYLIHVIEDDSIKSVAAAKALAKTTLAQMLLQHVEVEFESMVNPLLEEYDTVRIDTSEFSTNFVLTKFSIPLFAADGAGMTIGYNKERKINRGKFYRK